MDLISESGNKHLIKTQQRKQELTKVMVSLEQNGQFSRVRRYRNQ